MLFESPVTADDEMLVRVTNLTFMKSGVNVKEAAEDFTITEIMSEKRQIYNQLIEFGFLRNSGMSLSTNYPSLCYYCCYNNNY